MQAEAIYTPYSPAYYRAISDEHLAALAQSGDACALEYLIDKYRSFVRARARSYFIIGAEQDDILQEGMIGLYKAARDYREGRAASFHAFADLCITRQMITAIKSATRQKHMPLNSYISLNRPIYEDDSERTLMDVILPDEAGNPEQMLISREDRERLYGQISQVLSPLEWEVLQCYLQDQTYQQIAHRLNRHVKSVDNALMRIKKKLERVVSQG